MAEIPEEKGKKRENKAAVKKAVKEEALQSTQMDENNHPVENSQTAGKTTNSIKLTTST
jgi:hypothetical protein